MKIKVTVMKVSEMGELFDIPIELNYSGPYPFFKEGQEFIIDDEEKPDGFCRDAWHTLWPVFMSLRRGAVFLNTIKRQAKDSSAA